MIKNIIFDMGGVLLYYSPKFIGSCVFPNDEEASKISTIATESIQWHQLDQGIISQEEATKQICENNPQYSEKLKKYMDDWQNWMFPITGMYELILLLKQKGYTLHVLSNASLKFFDYTKLYGIFSLFDTINVSCEMKAIKPNHNIYQLMLNRNNLNANESLFIDDREENVLAAKELGLYGHVFKNRSLLVDYLKNEKII